MSAKRQNKTLFIITMKQPIIDFHQDEFNHWVADLACGHSQHVRHDPPWQNREWVLSVEGRLEKTGYLLDCVLCDQKE